MNPYLGISKIDCFAGEFEDSCNETIFKIAIVRKLPSGDWTVMSLKGKPLGKYKTKQEAVKRLRQIEYFKNHKKKKASKDDSYSAVMRDLRRSHDEETIKKFQREFKKMFDEALIAGSEEPSEEVLSKALECISFDDYKRSFQKQGSAIDLGNPEFAGKYLSDILKFLMRRINPERRTKSLENLRKKIYYLNEYQMASKRVPPSSAIGQSITLLKHILLEHNPLYIRNVLNNIVKHIP